MDGLLEPVVALARIGASRGTAVAARWSIMAVCGAVAALAATCAIGCAVAALWLFALPSLGPAGAALVAAAALAVLSIGLVGLALAVGRRGQREARLRNAAELALVEATLKDCRGAMMLAALIAGLASGRVRRERSSG